MQLYPAPNAPGVLYNYNIIKVNSYNTNTADLRIDQHFRDTGPGIFSL